MLTRATSVHVRYSCLNKTRRFSSSNRKVLTEACLTCTDPRFSVLEYGDVVIGTIPAGARNIVIKEATASKNNLCKYQRMSIRIFDPVSKSKNMEFITEQHQKRPDLNICKRVIKPFVRARQDTT